MYLEVSQTFQIWFSPFPARPSKVLTHLKLVEHDNHFYIKEQEDFYHLDDLMNCIVPPLAPLVMFFLELMAFAALLGSRFYLGLNAIWVALFKISDIGTPKMHQDNEGNKGNESMQ
ncbi:hypothetical protein J3A83DRAFT_4192379 [Scleroderma citrinum]